ncbi:MAG: AmmeMemoRadiSam system protein A [Kiritimatiellae bacterium]|nr:AmmeMemoRadiSam system protein A [Kiritimatiellia bacterium]
MSSTEPSCGLPTDDQQTLLRIAADSIRHGLSRGRPLPVVLERLAPALREKRATFVTLEKAGQLRGCIGTLDAHQALARDVADNAFNAAFRDPRFPPVADAELDALEIHISLLTPSEPMSFESEEDLLRQVRPGMDGLILQEGFNRGTFLPAVWEQLPDARDFLKHLKLKAGLPPDYWSRTLKVWRYRAEMIG